ncbi:MAG: hypothetical protein IKA20_00180, partial [Clostridia bacterium]|nr:hypothetical protein [Clostridia bacterium]
AERAPLAEFRQIPDDHDATLRVAFFVVTLSGKIIKKRVWGTADDHKKCTSNNCSCYLTDLQDRMSMRYISALYQKIEGMSRKFKDFLKKNGKLIFICSLVPVDLIILGYVGFTFIEDLKERYEKNNKK